MNRPATVATGKVFHRGPETVHLWRWSNGAWHRLKSTKTRASGRFAFQVTQRTRGTQSYAVVATTAGKKIGESKVLSTHVHKFPALPSVAAEPRGTAPDRLASSQAMRAYRPGMFTCTARNQVMIQPPHSVYHQGQTAWIPYVYSWSQATGWIQHGYQGQVLYGDAGQDGQVGDTYFFGSGWFESGASEVPDSGLIYTPSPSIQGRYVYVLSVVMERGVWNSYGYMTSNTGQSYCYSA